MPPASAKRSADSQLVPVQIGVRSANRRVSIRISAAPVFKPSCLASSRVAGSSLARDHLAARLVAAGADDFGKPRAGAQGIGDPRRLDIGAAAAFGAHQAALRQGRERPAHGVAIDAIHFGDFGFAGQLFAGGEVAVGDTALDAVGDLTPQRHAGRDFLHGHGVLPPGMGIGKIITLSRNSHGAWLSSCLVS